MLQKLTGWIPLLLSALFLLTACSQEKQWVYQNSITLPEQVSPLGLTYSQDSIWISAPDQKKVLTIDKSGNILEEYPGLERPMHISAAQDKIYVPVYLNDQVLIIQKGVLDTLHIGTEPDAPAGVSVKGDTVAVADFYNHRIILRTGELTSTIGEKGHEKGQLFYPTDVELAGDKIYVADAYNNRVQVFDKKGNPLLVIGEKDNINVATGIAVYDGQLFVTDYFNNKILVYDPDGNLTQTLEGHFNKPTDIGVINGELYIPNYGASSIVRFTRK